MKIKKLKDTYNDYQCEMSFGQLTAIKNALARDHSDPLSDELYAELEWYLQNVPGPGESEEDIKAAEEAGKSGLGQAPPGDQQAPPNAADELLPSPEGEEGPGAPGDELGGEPGGEPGGDLGGPGGEPGGDLGAPGGEPGGAPGEEPPPAPEDEEGAPEADRRLPRPPAE